MSAPNQLPVPDADALGHSEQLVRLIRDRIAAAGGWIDFAEYMDLALNAPGLGYYSAGAQKFGPGGDFVTAPEISALFPACIARTCAERFAASERPGTILELGAGTGALAAGVLGTLEGLDRLPDRYLILEISADLRDRQRRLLTERVPDLVARVAWLDELPDPPIDGVILANEVLDALPVSRFEIAAAGGIDALGVVANDAGFDWQARPAERTLEREVRAISAAIGAPWPAGYRSEFVPGLAALIDGLSRSLAEGLILLIDYGLPRRAYYSPERTDGTLACHYRQRMHADPFRYPGLQDITAWVDFTRVAQAAAAAQLDVLGFTTQAQYLLAAGIDQELTRQLAADDAQDDYRERLRLSAELQTLIMPGQMGESFKVMALGRNLPDAPDAIRRHDLLHLL